MIFKPVVRSTQTLHLYCVMISTITKRTEKEHQLEPRHLRVPLGAYKTISKPMARLAQTVHLSCTDTNTVSKRTETRFHITHVTKEFYRVHPKRFLSL
jgi:hypothetical protein